MCRDASSVSEIVTYEGSLEAGVALKVVGLNATGKVTKEQWKNIEQKYGEFRSNPTVCNIEMMKLIAPRFGEAPLPYKKIACVGEYDGKCPGPHDAFYTCEYFGTDVQIAAQLCQNAASTATRLKTVGGNKCGYGLIEASCVP